MLQNIKFKGRRPLTYHQRWMVGGPYSWEPGGYCAVEEKDAIVLTRQLPRDFTAVGKPFEKREPVISAQVVDVYEVPADIKQLDGQEYQDGIKHICPYCAKEFKAAKGLAGHMRFCPEKTE